MQLLKLTAIISDNLAKSHIWPIFAFEKNAIFNFFSWHELIGQYTKFQTSQNPLSMILTHSAVWSNAQTIIASFEMLICSAKLNSLMKTHEKPNMFLRKPEPPLGVRGAMGLGLGWIDISGSNFLHVLLLVSVLVFLNEETKKATIWPSNKLHGQNLWQTSPFRRFVHVCLRRLRPAQICKLAQKQRKVLGVERNLEGEWRPFLSLSRPDLSNLGLAFSSHLFLCSLRLFFMDRE